MIYLLIYFGLNILSYIGLLIYLKVTKEYKETDVSDFVFQTFYFLMVGILVSLMFAFYFGCKFLFRLVFGEFPKDLYEGDR